jgi:hypothetical protein
MSQILLYDAKLEEDFLEAARFYDNGPIFFIVNVKIKSSIYEKLDSVMISYFNEDIFKSQFRSNNTVSTSNYKFYNIDTEDQNQESNDINKDLVQYHTGLLGRNSIYSYNQSNESQIKSISVIKRNVYHINKSNYKIFIPFSESTDVLNLENSGNNQRLKLRIYFKDDKKNIIWDSDILTPPYTLSQYINNINAELRYDYLSFYVQNTLESASLSYNTLNSYPNAPAKQQTLQVSFGNAFDFSYSPTRSDNNADVLSNNQNVNILYLLKYKSQNILPVENVGSFVRQNGQTSINSLDLLYFHGLSSQSNITNQIVSDYFSGEENFNFNISLSINTETESNSRSIPSYDIVLNRSNIHIKKIVEEFKSKFENQIKAKINPTIQFENIDPKKTRHTISISGIETDLTLTKLKSIFFNGRLYDYNNIYFSNEGTDVSKIYSLTEFNNIQEMLSENIEGDSSNLIFYTYNNSSVYGSSRVSYDFEYTLSSEDANTFNAVKRIFGTENINISLNEYSYLSDVVLLNSIIKANATIIKTPNESININLSSNPDNSMITKIESFVINRLDNFDDLAAKYGYEDTLAFLRSSIVRITAGSNFKPFNRELGIDKFYTLDEIFAGSNETSTITSNLTFNNDIIQDYSLSQDNGIRFLNSLIQNKTYELNELIRRFPDFEYSNGIEIQVFPIHETLRKYKSKGIDSNFNIVNLYDNEIEVKEAERLFYLLMYTSEPTLNYSTFLRSKESFFSTEISNRYFYDSIKQNISEKLSRNNFYSNRTTINAQLFLDIIENSEGELIDESEPSYAYDFSNKMFSKEIKAKSFKSGLGKEIIWEKTKFSRSKPSQIISLNYSDTIMFDTNIIKRIQGDQETSVTSTGLTEGQYDIRLCLVPYFSFDTLSSNNSSFDENNNTFESVSYNNVNCITLKENVYNDLNFKKDIYTGFLNNKIFLDDNNDFNLIFESAKQKNNIFNINHMISYYERGVINQAIELGYNKLYELALNVAVIVTSGGSKSNIKYYSDYYQIKLLNNKKEEDAIPIGNIREIRFNNI